MMAQLWGADWCYLMIAYFLTCGMLLALIFFAVKRRRALLRHLRQNKH